MRRSKALRGDPFDEAIARFAGRNSNHHFFEVSYGAQAIGASASDEISHMRRPYSTLSPPVATSSSIGKIVDVNKANYILVEIFPGTMIFKY